jgi:hypothetical protein
MNSVMVLNLIWDAKTKGMDAIKKGQQILLPLSIQSKSPNYSLVKRMVATRLPLCVAFSKY